MMMMMMKKLFTFGTRQLHTIVSRDIIKPSSPTPCHLKTYNLSLLDRIAMNSYMPVVIFYSNSETKLDLKNSLSQTLTKYYPFAGSLYPTYVDCNDEGVEFIEAYNDSQLSDFLQHSDHQDLDPLFPDERIWYKSNHKDSNDEKDYTSPLAIQVNHFGCGGVAVAASLYHKLGDAGSLLNFINHWATVTRSQQLKDASHINPHFLSHQIRNVDLPTKLPHRPHGDYVTQSFLFPKKKINELKGKVADMAKEAGQPLMNLTGVEVLTWLIHNCLVAAATKNSGTFKANGLGQILSMRNNLVEVLPQTSVGNLFLTMEFPISDQSELAPNMFIGQLRKRKMEFRSIRSFQTAIEMVAETCSETTILETLDRLDAYYIYSNLYGLPTYGIDFGWGEPVKLSVGGALKNVVILMDTPNGDGIEALVSLERHDMKIVQNDPELLAFC